MNRAHLQGDASAAWPEIRVQYDEASAWLDSLITDPAGQRYLTPDSPKELSRKQEAIVPRLRRFLQYLGNPQQSYSTVHIAGTGGKGSVATMVDAILRSSSVKSGLYTSPYLQVPNEKLVANGTMIAPSHFASLVEELRRCYMGYVEQHPEDWPRYGETWMALAHMFFKEAGVDWAVVETGMGGRFDPTNVGNSDLAIITNIDYDHVPQLGTTLGEIAWHKSGIIKPGMQVITGETKQEALEVIEREARAQSSTLYRLGSDFYAGNIRSAEAGVTADIATPFGSIKNLFVSLPGAYQATNATIAVMSALLLRETRGLPISEQGIRQALSHVKMAGRMEVMQREPLVIIDGAHNPQKMRAAATVLRDVYPAVRKTLVIGMLKTKDAHSSLAEILPVSGSVIATQPRVVGKPSFSAEDIAGMVRELAPDMPVEVQPDVREAVKAAVGSAGDGMVFVTGSIYMLGQAREVWHPSDDLLRGLEYGAIP